MDCGVLRKWLAILALVHPSADCLRLNSSGVILGPLLVMITPSITRLYRASGKQGLVSMNPVEPDRKLSHARASHARACRAREGAFQPSGGCVSQHIICSTSCMIIPILKPKLRARVCVLMF